jgi:hypothetical protein
LWYIFGRGNEIWAGIVAVVLANVVLVGYVIAAMMESGEDSRVVYYQKDKARKELLYEDNDYVADELSKEKIN